MSKTIVIQEGGLGVQLTVDKLKTDLQGGGTKLWLPEDEVALTTKHITEDGTYAASDEGCYGFSQVSVSGIGRVYGKDEDGDDAVVDTDGDGNIREKKLPSSIVITSLPSVTAYANGATIDFTGMVVKAYTKTGALWTDSGHPDGIIPINELILPVTVASTSGSGVVNQYYTDGNGVNAMKLNILPTWYSVTDPRGNTQEYQTFVHPEPLGYDDDYIPRSIYQDGPATMLATIVEQENVEWHWLYLAALTGDLPMSSNQARKYTNYVTANNYIRNGWYPPGGGTPKFIMEYNKFYGIGGNATRFLTEIPRSTADPANVDPTAMTISSAMQNIPVRWDYPGAASTMEASFVITVTGTGV